jgi:hypothetical protein
MTGQILTKEQQADHRKSALAWYHRNREAVLAKRRLDSKPRIYTEEQRRKYRIRNSQWQKLNRKKSRERTRRSRIKNREKVLIRERAYRKANRDLINDRNRKRDRKVNKRLYVFHRRKMDYFFRLRCALANRINRAIRKGISKSNTTIQLIGCDIPWLIAWLEVQFQPGMSWENYGLVWHIDHIRPCATFDLTDPHQQKLCFHWTNLQPLLAAENLSKGARWDQAEAA